MSHRARFYKTIDIYIRRDILRVSQDLTLDNHKFYHFFANCKKKTLHKLLGDFSLNNTQLCFKR